MARYEANGNVAAIEDANNVLTKATYNAIGQRTAVNDPNQGSWGFAYNALGEVLAQSDARGIGTTLSYDKLGRPKRRNASIDVTGDNVADALADNWTYDPVNAKGAPEVAQRTINGQLERSSTQSYDTLARPVQTYFAQSLSSGIQGFIEKTKYDSYYGRPVGQEFPNGEAVQVLYSIYGHGLAEKDPGTGTEYRRTNSVNARGQATQETFGNGVTLTPQYQLQTGQLTGLTYSSTLGTLRQLGYGYDVYGNLKRQSLNAGASREDYSYDQLHRLVQSIRSGGASGTVSYGFDAVGNLSRKSDFSSNTANAYSYTGGTCGGGANAVKSVQLAAGGTRSYCYDANGNLTSDSAGLSLKYDHQNLPTVAQRGALKDEFRYGADGMRTRSWGSDGNRVYLPGYEHRTDTGETKVYIGDYAVISKIGATRKVEYLLRDRLGSVDGVANASGAVIETRGYDAFGKPRNGTWNDLSPAKIQSTAVTPKGFTQHEHLNQLELIHMNGRAYDYNLGRFTGVDPFIQFPLNSQSLNPYSYIMNSPLSGTDPTGYSCTPMTGSHVCGADTGAQNGQSTSTTKKTDGGIDVRTTKTVYSGGGSTTNVTGRANGGSAGQGVTGAGDRKEHLSDASQKGSSSGACNGGSIPCGSGSGPDPNSMMGQRMAACEAMGGCPGHVPNRAETDGAVAGGQFANENKWEIATFFLAPEIKLPKFLSKLGKLFGIGGKATESAAGIRGAKAMVGSGPAPGFIEVSDAYRSAGIVKGFQGKSTDFIFDTRTNRFVMGTHAEGHTGLAKLIGYPESMHGQGHLVGGTIFRRDGVLMTNEHSGHFGHLWNDASRANFQKFVDGKGVGSTHSPTW